MDKILSFKRYKCGYEEFNFSELYRQCNSGIKKLPVNVFLIEHKKKGHILINTGCSNLLKKNPVAYAKLTAKRKLFFEEKDSISAQLLAEGIDPICIKKVLLTHCDPECCGSLPLLPKYELLSNAGVLSLIWLSDTADGIMKNTVPSEEVSQKAAGLYKGDTFLKQYFKWVYDVFDDGSILAVDITGHAKAMTAFYLTEKNIFIAADASIDETALTENLVPSDKLLNRQFFPDDYISVLVTLKKIKKEHPQIKFKAESA